MPLAAHPPGTSPRSGLPPAVGLARGLIAPGHSPALAGTLGLAEAERLAAIVKLRAVAPHVAIFHEDGPVEHLFVLGSGTVKLGRLLADGRRQIIVFLFPGDVLGLEADGQYLCHAEAITPVVLACLPRRRLEAIIDECPHLARVLLAVAAHEVAAAQEHMVLLGRRTAEERVAAFLLDLARRAAERGQPVGTVPLPMTRADIADYLGLEIETVSRICARWQREGVLGPPERGRVALLDRAALERLTEAG